MQRCTHLTDSARSRAFEACVGPHVEALHRVALRILRADDLAWDAVQETLLRAWSYPDLPERPRALLVSLVRRSCLHILRCARRRSDHESLAADGPHTTCCSMDPGGPAATAAERDELRRAESAAARLTAEHREVLDLVAWRGLSYREAADTLSVPVGTVRSRTSRARAALQRLLEETAPPC